MVPVVSVIERLIILLSILDFTDLMDACSTACFPSDADIYQCIHW